MNNEITLIGNYLEIKHNILYMYVYSKYGNFTAEITLNDELLKQVNIKANTTIGVVAYLSNNNTIVAKQISYLQSGGGK